MIKELSNKQNIVVIADEAHKSQYDFIDGFARHMREELKPRLDAEFEEATEGEEIERKEGLKTKWAQLEAVVAHGERLPFADATFDCAVASEVIEHLPEPERVPDEMWRVVRPGGRVLISTPYRERIRYVLCIHILPKPAHIVAWRGRA